jgi:hypothetical protein
MIEEELYIKELWDLRHLNDKNQEEGFDYETKFIERSTSEVLRRNNNLREFLNRLQKQMVWMVQSTLVVRNFWNYTVHKYYDKHND